MDLQQRFSLPLLAWFETEGRKELPWQNPPTPYRVWVSEIMLQQTQVKTVIPYFLRFMEAFPDIASLAQASQDAVLARWSGLGYYSRARNLHQTASIIHTQYQDIFPSDVTTLQTLPGIGESTAAAICSLAFNKPTAILDGNVKRVLCRYFLIDGVPDKAATKQRLWDYATRCMPQQRCADYTQAIMDLGATCCTRANPQCSRCPITMTCLAKKHNKVMNYPHKKPTKSLPIKKQQFLLLYTADGLIYLEKRPATGLWGALWCLPSIAMDNNAADYVRQHYQFEVQNTKLLTHIKHSFSHFQLHIEAIALAITIPTNQLAEPQGQWFNEHALPRLGLAKPIQQILQLFVNG